MKSAERMRPTSLRWAATKARKKVQLIKPPRQTGEVAWWEEDFLNALKIRDRELFA